MLTVKIKYNIKGLESSYEKLFGNNGLIVDEVSKKIVKDIKKYVPRDTGKLMKSAVYKKGGLIEWHTPYANYVYHGKTKGGREMKYNKSKASMAGPRWTERYLADNEKVLSNYATNVFKKNMK